MLQRIFSYSPVRGAFHVAALIVLLLGPLAAMFRFGPIVVAMVAAVVVLMMVFAWPRTANISRTILYLTMLAYLAPLLALGKSYAVVGIGRIYLADVLLSFAALLMLPQVKLGRVRPFGWVCLFIALLALQSVYVGYHNGYPAAIKGIVLALYPLIAVVVAGWLANQQSLERVLSPLPTIVLPLAGPGVALTAAAHTNFTSAAAGLSVAIVAAFAVVPGMPRRRLLALSLVLGTVVLVAATAERGPAIAIFVAAFSSWIASRQFRSGFTVATTALVVGMFVTVLALTTTLGFVAPAKVPVAGKLISRTLALNEGSSATNAVDVTAANNADLRVAIWSYALRATNQHPVFGVGSSHPVDVNYKGNDLSTQNTGVHNSFVGYAFYAGYPAALLVVAAFSIGLVRIWRARKRTIYAPALFGALIAVVVTALTNVAFETTYIGGPSWLILGAAVGLAGTLDRGRV